MGMVFVTGGSRGIGRAICTAFARTGRDVAFCYSRDEEGARETARLIEKAGAGALPLRLDVADEAAVQAAFAALPGLEILVNNAGIAHFGQIQSTTSDIWRRIFAVNVDGAFFCTRAAIPKFLRRGGGSIVNISSVWGEAGASCEAAFFANSGAESNEGLIKLARKWSFDKYGKGRGTILTLKNSFHGRTVTTLSATGQEVFHNYFFPFTDGFRYAEPTMDGISQVSGHDVCAVLLELVQGESGVWPLDQDFVHDLAVLCAERDWLLLVDEVQTGIGRTGTLFCYQQYGILPDAVSFAKGIAGGLPFGGFLVSEKCRDVLGSGDHATTFGGNPICSAAALATLEILSEEAMGEISDKGKYLRDAIDAMALPCFGPTRGLGLMIGIEVKPGHSNREIAETLMDNGLLVLTAGPAIRLLPPLTITKDEMDKGLAILKQTLV